LKSAPSLVYSLKRKLMTDLRYAVPLWIKHTRHAKLNAVEHRRHFQNSVIERRANEILPHIL